MTELIHKLLDEIRGGWRFRTYALLAAWGVCLVGWAAVFAMPDLYLAGARVFVDTRTALRPVIQGLTLEQDIGAQLNLVRSSLLSRPHLEKVAAQTGMFAEATTPAKRLSIIESMSKRIQLDVHDAGGGGGVVYVLQYQYPDREKALAVVTTLIDAFMKDTLGGKRDNAEMAQTFLREQIGDYEHRLQQAEERLAEFKKRNVGLMPGAQGDYFTRLQAENARLDKARDDLSLALARKEELQRQLRGDAAIASVQAPQPTGPNAASGGDTASRILETQKRLEELLLRYTEKHPDVVSLKETLRQLEGRRDAEIADLRSGRGALPASAATNPVVQSIQLAMNQVNVEIVTLRNHITDYQNKIAELKKLVDTAPEVEAEFARLNRDYDVTRQQYTALLERSERARLGDQAEQTQSIRFELIDPPAATFRPVAPNRPLLVMFVLVLGLGAGGALAFVLHHLKPVFTSTHTLNAVTGLPVLGVVSRTWLERGRFSRHREYIKFGAAAFALLVVCVIVVRLNIAGFRLSQLIG